MLHVTHSLSSVTLDCNQTMSLGPAEPQDEDSNESFKSNATLELEYSFVPCPKKTVFVSLKSMLIKRTNIRDESQRGPCRLMNSIVEDRVVPAVCDSSTSDPFCGVGAAADSFVDVDSSVVVVVSSDVITEDSKCIPEESKFTPEVSEHNHIESIFHPKETHLKPEISHFKSEELNMNPEDTSNLNPQDFFDYEFPQSETDTVNVETVEPTEFSVKEENVEPTEFNVKEENVEPAEITVKEEKIEPTVSNCETENSILSTEMGHGAEPCTVVMTEDVLCDIQANYTISEMESTSDVKPDSHDSTRIDESVSKDKVKMSRSERSRSKKCSYSKSKSRRSCSKSRKRSKSRSKSKNSTRRKSRSVSRNRYRSRRSRSKGKHPKSRNRRRSRSRSRPRRKPRSLSISFKKSRSRSRRKSPPRSKRKSRSRSRKKSRSRSRRKSLSHSKRKFREISNSRSRRKSRSKSPHKSLKSSPKVENSTLPIADLNDIASMIKIEDVLLPSTSGDQNESAPIIKEEIENPAESVFIKSETMDPPEEQKSILSCDPTPKPANITLRLMKMASEESEAVPCSSKCEQKPPSSDPIKLRDKSRSRSRKRSDRKSRSRSRGRADSGGKRDGLQGFYYSRYEVMKQRILNTPIKDFQNISKMSGMSSDGFFNCEGTNIGIPGANKDDESDEFVLPPLNLRVFVAADHNKNIFSTIAHCCFHNNCLLPLPIR
ncbi:serine/arginine repetitive matrix protein 5-like isoform X2 [Bolinopsis microptera]|uniref:serine/arginine repetitive matrix protein 5-like isoform X2 n=1 Tax=Bolinopsis microptera TaxID=2820187 RepID=UPI003079E139